MKTNDIIPNDSDMTSKRAVHDAPDELIHREDFQVLFRNLDYYQKPIRWRIDFSGMKWLRYCCSSMECRQM
jgi:hypothetical protein